MKEPVSGRGLFFRNDIDLSMEGWLCEARPLTLFGWECIGIYFPPEAFGDVANGAYIKKEGEEEDAYVNAEGKPLPRKLPNIFPKNRKVTGNWTCGVENLGDYTQANCKSDQPPDNRAIPNRFRYTPDFNMNFYGLKYDKKSLEWFSIGRRALQSAESLMVGASIAVSLLTL